MVKIIKKITTIMVLVTLMSTNICFGHVSASSERTTVTNSLPDVCLYIDTDIDYGISKENTTVLVDDKDSEIQYADVFKNSNEGTAYFVLVDVSKSIASSDLTLIKNTILNFAKELSDQDRIYLIPFGESVYVEQKSYLPSEKAFEKAVNDLALTDDYTQLYAALDASVGLVESEEFSDGHMRKIAMVFTDGIDDTNGGLITEDEAIVKMNNAGLPLYAFAVGDNKSGKDSLGVLSRNINGSLYILDEGYKSTISGFKNVVDNSLYIKTKVKNSEDILDYFTVRVLIDDKELIVKENIRSHKTSQSRDFLSVRINKLLHEYWWVIALVAFATIILIALTILKKNKGYVNVEGKVVYGSNIQRKYHVMVKEYNKKTLNLDISVNGGNVLQQRVDIIESLIVGRSNICDLYFEDINMSRQHFALEIKNESIYIYDLDSTSGTFLNGIKVEKRQQINNGDVINAGKTKIRIRFE